MPNVISKTQISQMVAMGLAHEAFTHEHYGTFDVTLMRNAALAGQYGEILCSAIDERTLFIVAKCRDWEKDRVLWLIENNKLHDPCLCLDAPDDTQIIIDGTHRLLARYAVGLKTFLWYRAQWNQAIRPSNDMIENPRDWGKIAIRNGKLYDRETNELWKTPKRKENP